jgi:thiopurine S-methyltransferase
MHEDWIARWRDGRTGFHEGQPNALLERHISQLEGSRRVLVPLCGKAEDLAFLATRGHDVVGIELAEQAVREFFDAHGLVPSVVQRGALIELRADAIAVLVGDVFAATPALVGPIDALYDRAALVALPPDLRPRYAAHLRTLLPNDAPGLVITFEYDQQRMAGPPFAVLEPELRSLFAGRTLELLEERPAPSAGKLAQSGVQALERCFAIRPDGRG